jgi:hypothetical protein
LIVKPIQGIPKDFSAREKKRATRWIDKNPAMVGTLLNTFLATEYRESQRLARVLEAVAKRDQNLLQPHLKKLLMTLDSSKATTGLKRNIPRIIQWMHIPSKFQGRAVNTFFRLLADPSELVAAKVFSMTVLANIAQEQPDLKNEIRQQIEAQYNLSTAAFRSRARKVIKMLDR